MALERSWIAFVPGTLAHVSIDGIVFRSFTPGRGRVVVHAAWPNGSTRGLARLMELGDRRARCLARPLPWVKGADPEVVDGVEHTLERVPVWSHNGLVCAGETCKSS